jgi:hypothetical protein
MTPEPTSVPVSFEIIIDPEFRGDAIHFTDIGLTTFYTELLLGKGLHLRFAIPRVSGLDIVLAMALFLNRDTLLQPKTPGLVMLVDLAVKHGPQMLSHAEADLTNFLVFLQSYVVQDSEKLTKIELGERLSSAIGWIRDYLMDDRLPHLGSSAQDEVRVIDVGSNGFVLATTTDDAEEAWFDLFRAGHLRGVVLGPEKNGRRDVFACRKSLLVDFDVRRAAFLLTEVEQAFEGTGEWLATDRSVKSPEGGTILSIANMLEVFLRV